MKLFLILLVWPFVITGCGSLTGLPGHGGGKRFAIEQELVAAASREAIKHIDFTIIHGKKVNLFLNAIDDKGSGNLIGGRLSLVSQIRGDYVHTPTVTERSYYPRYDSTSTTSSASQSETNSSSNGSYSSGRTSESSTSTTTTNTLLSSPERTESTQQGFGTETQVGVEYDGLGSYQNSDEVASGDLQYLLGLLQTYLFLCGVHLVPPSEAEIDIYVIVDVFGTVRTRVDWFFANNEILSAKTALEVMAVERSTGALIMEPQSASAEAEYNEQYLVWAGPLTIKKYLKTSQPLLSDFSGLPLQQPQKIINEQDTPVLYPFRKQTRE